MKETFPERPAKF